MISGTEGISEKGEVSNVFNKNCIQTVQLEKPVKQPVALCFDDKGRLYVSTFQGSVFLIELQLDLVSIRRTVLHLLNLIVRFCME